MKQSNMLATLEQEGLINVRDFEEHNEKRATSCDRDIVKRKQMRECLTQYDLPDGSIIWVGSENEFWTEEDL